MSVHSDWGDWLPAEVESSTPDGVSIWYLGCNGFVLKGSEGTTIFIDPYLGTGDPPRTVRMIPIPFAPEDVREADAVLATHEHTDHTHGPSQAPILAETGAAFYGSDSCLAVTRDEGWTENWDVSQAQLNEITEGQTLEIGEFTVHVEPAKDPDAEHPVSFVIEHDAGTFFHGGDARPGPQFEEIGEEYDIDLGVLAFGTPGMIPDKETGEPTFTKWYSSEQQIAKAARQLELDTLLPSHWDMWKGLTADPTALHEHVKSFNYPTTLTIREIGSRIEI
jgi:L-ascorbate 6-phosphate lactonase